MNSDAWPPWALHESDLYSHSQYERGYALAPCGSLAEGFRPPVGEVADFTVVWDGTRWHLFHIVRHPMGDCYFPGHEIYFGHSSTPDLVRWTHHPPVLLVEPGTWRGCHLWAPFVIKLGGCGDDTWAMFYTGVDRKHQQRIGMATSGDLFDWRYWGSEPLFDPGALDWTASCIARDPHAIRLDDRLLLYYTSAATGDRSRAIGLASASERQLGDCIKLAPAAEPANGSLWHDHGPVLSLPSGGGICGATESCCVAPVSAEQWVIFFGYGNGLWYATSPEPYSFSQSEPEQLVEGLTGLEVLATGKEIGEVWLVACFAWPNYRQVARGRLILGELDWEDGRPRFERITDEERLAQLVNMPNP